MELSLSQLEDYKRVLINTFKAFDTFCLENNLKYFGGGGTAIGAIRHHGIIPWDDDIDVCMIREDYNRFLSLKGKLDSSKYRIVDTSEKGYYLPFAKFIDSNTTLWEYEEKKCLIGVFIDVFPLDHTDGNKAKIIPFREKYMANCVRYARGFEDNFCETSLKKLKSKNIKDTIYWLMNVLYYKPFHFFYKYKFKKNESIIRNGKGNYLLNFYSPYPIERELFPAEWFQYQITLPFESITIKLPNGYDNMLSQLFGDYMKMPPVEKRVTHHSHYFCDTTKKWELNEILEKRKYDRNTR